MGGAELDYRVAVSFIPLVFADLVFLRYSQCITTIANADIGHGYRWIWLSQFISCI